MHKGDGITPSTNTRKKRFKSSFRYSTMKELKKAREYKRAMKKSSDEPSSVTKTLRVVKKLDTIGNANLEKGFQTPPPFNSNGNKVSVAEVELMEMKIMK
jgi:hypothetical protein